MKLVIVESPAKAKTIQGYLGPEYDVEASVGHIRDLASRAMQLIDDGLVDREGVGGVARRLAVSERHLHRILVQELGAAPLPLAQPVQLPAMQPADVAHWVRTAEERKFVGHVPDSLHVAWATGTGMTRNPRFVKELEAKVGKDAVVLLLCRSGKRSAAAAEAAARAGFSAVFNVLEGFEGELDADTRRGGLDGWRFHGLPWVQD